MGVGKPFRRSKLVPVVNEGLPRVNTQLHTGDEHKPFVPNDVFQVVDVSFHKLESIPPHLPDTAPAHTGLITVDGCPVVGGKLCAFRASIRARSPGFMAAQRRKE